jgi:integrase
MSPQLAETLKKRKGNFKRKVADVNTQPEYVFKNCAGGLIDANNWRKRIFKKAIEKAKLRRIRIHDLRHTYATLRIAKGDNLGDVSRQLGHHSVKLTLDIYYHWMPGEKKAEVDALDDLSPMHLNAPQVHPATSERKKGTANVG